MQLSVDNRLLTRLPHFFQSFPESLTEVVQNSYRGGAQHLDFHWNSSTRILTITDDGHGIANPTDLFTAGRSGWDSSVVEPAGLGFFALLGLCQSLTIINHHALSSWQVQLTPQSLEGPEFAITTLPLYWKTGVVLKAVLPQDVDVSKVITDTTWRQFYPLTVTWSSNNEAPVVIPGPEQFNNTHALSLPSGTLFPSTTKHEYRTLETIWEHRLISQTNAYSQLINRLEGLPHGATVANFLPRHFTWILPENTAVRPKLPDRREVINNAAWTAAITQLAQDLIAAFSPETVQSFYNTPQAATLLPPALCHYRLDPINNTDWPVARNITDQVIPLYSWHPFWDINSQGFLKMLGYQKQSIPDPQNFYYDEDEDFPQTTLSYWFRTPMHLASDAAVMNCLLHHIPALYDPQALPLTVEVTQMECIPDPDNTLWFQIARADSIQLKQDDQVLAQFPDWIQFPHSFDLNTDTLVVNHIVSTTPDILWIKQGSPEDILETISETSIPWIFLALAAQSDFPSWDYIDGDEGEHYLSFDHAFRALHHLLLTTWRPDEIAQQQRRTSLLTVHHAYLNVLRELTDLEHFADDSSLSLTDQERQDMKQWAQALTDFGIHDHPVAPWMSTRPKD